MAGSAVITNARDLTVTDLANAAQANTIYGARGTSGVLHYSVYDYVGNIAAGGVANAMSAAENITAASGQDSHWATGGAFRLHTGQSIGMLAGAVQPGTEAAGKGITLIAAQGDTQIQAQSDSLQIAAKQQLSIQSETANIDWAAAKKITLATAGGASIVIEGGNINVMCPGTITVQASAKSFSGPANVSYSLPKLPRAKPVCIECMKKAAEQGAVAARR